MRVQENKIESGMEGLNIEDQSADCAVNQPSAENQGMRKGCRRHKFHRDGAGPENKAQWREMRRQRMAMIRQAMKDNESAGFAPYGMMPPMMFGPPPPGFGPHHQHHMHHHGRRHFHPRFNPMMYVGPHSNQFEGDLDPFMVPRPAFHPGMMAMMIPMFAGYDKGCHNKKKCKKGESEASVAADNTQESGEERPPFMMKPWMFKGRGFKKCMNPDDCQKMGKQDLTENGEKGQNEHESAGMETDVKGNDSQESAHHGKQQQIRFMKRIMAMNGGYPPMMAMYPGAVCPPGMMRKFMQKNKCQHKNKCEKSESDDSSASSGDDVLDEHTACKDAECVPEQSDVAENPEGANSDNHAGNESGNDRRKKHGWHQRHMRAMMMNGGFPPMWFMMSQGGFPHQQFRHKGKENPKQQKQSVEDKNHGVEDEMC